MSKTQEKNEENSNAIPKQNFQYKYFTGHDCYLPPTFPTKYTIKCGKFKRFILLLTSIRHEDVRARYMFRSHTALCAETYRQYADFPFSIHPFSRLKLAVEILTIAVLLVLYTINAAYSAAANKNVYYEFIIMFCEFMYIPNIITNTCCGYIAGDTCRYVVLDLKKILWRYIKSWMVVDLLFISGLTEYRYLIEHIYWRHISILVQILRVPLLFKYVSNVMQVLGASVSLKTAVEAILLIYNYLVWNIFLQFYIEYAMEDTYKPTNPRECSWMTIMHVWNASTTERFIFAVNRAVGQLRQNSNLHLLNQGGCFENFFMISWVIAKLIVVHCCLKYMVVLFGLESARAKYFVMSRQVSTYMNHRKFPDRLKRKILKFYAVRYQNHFFVESRMMECLSGQLREDILMHSGRQLVSQVEFLKQLPRGLLLQMSDKLKVVIFLAGDIIFKINTIGDSLYFIDKGTVAIYSESGKEICHLQDGDFFGEIALIMNNRFRTASVVAVTNCDLFRLAKNDFENTIACYPTVYDNIKNVASSRLERTIVMDEHHRDELRSQRV